VYVGRPEVVEDVAAAQPIGLAISSENTFGILQGVLNEVVVADPRLEFARVCQAFFSKAPASGIADSATVDPTASIGIDVLIEAGAYIGPDVVIGHRCRIGANAVLYADSHLGDDVVVGPGTVIGHSGFGYARDIDGTPVPLPHICAVRIGDRVEIGANAAIDRGTLTDTVIESDVKIDNLVHVAHNCHVGRGAFVIASSVLCGSVRIGARSWIAPNAAVREHLEVGEDAVVGLSTTVLQSVPAGTTVAGSPARAIGGKPPIDGFSERNGQ
jgi:UDP-3-O-[3-hydroxymyristoyl] glucosamine N-acyltransferase